MVKKSNPLILVFTIILSLFILISPYYRGLYFENNMYYAELYVFLLLIVTAALLVNKLNINFDQGRYWLILLIPFSYIVSFVSASSPLLAIQTILRFLTYSFIFLNAFLIFSQHKLANKVLQVAILIATGWLTYFVWMNAWGQADFKDAILGNRFSSVFQYPNTYGALLIGIIIGSLILTIRHPWTWTTLGSFFLVPFQVAFFMTYSRGAWLIFPVIYLIILTTLTWKKQIRFLLNTLISFILSLLAYQKLNITVTEIDASTGWKLLIIYSSLTILINLVINYTLKKLSKEPIVNRLSWKQIIIPSLLIVIALIGINTLLTNDEVVNKLPESIAKRINSISLENSSLLARNDFNEDALKIYKEHYLIGTGGGGWKALFQKYQDYSYWSTQSHNFISQLLVEVGTIGSLIFLIVFAYFLYSAFKKYIKGNEESRLTQSYWLAILMALIVHSFIDFNMTFGYIGILVFLSLAGLYIPTEVEPTNHISTAKSKQKGSKQDNSKKTFGLKSDLVRIYSAMKWISVLVSIVSIIIVYRFIVAEESYSTLQNKNLTGNQIYQNVKTAVSLNPFDANYRLTYADILYKAGKQNNDQSFIDESNVQLEKALKLEPYNPVLQYRASSISFNKGNMEEGLVLLEQAIKNGRWTIEFYEKYINNANMYGTELNEAGHTEEAKLVWGNALNYYKQIQKQGNYLQENTKGVTKRPFGLNDQIKLDIGEIQIKMNDVEQAKVILNEVLMSKDENIKITAAKWLIIANEKLGNQDEALRIKNEYFKEK